jgi:AcrR family transcriptional regulator
MWSRLRLQPTKEYAVPGPTRLRADAQENRDRVLQVAAGAFGREGADASLKDIAREAGVGIGTLYRRFPTRAALVEAVYRNEAAALADSAEHLLAHHTPVDSLTQWMDSFIELMFTKRGMAEVLYEVLAQQNDLRMSTRELLADALALLLAAGAAEGSIQTVLPPAELLLALGGVTTMAVGEGDRELAHRVIRVLVAGLTAPR